MSLDSTHQLLSGAVVLISLLFGVVSFFLVRLLTGVEDKFKAVEKINEVQEQRLNEHGRKIAVLEVHHENALRTIQRLERNE